MIFLTAILTAIRVRTWHLNDIFFCPLSPTVTCMNFPCRPLIAGIIIQLWIMEPGRLMIRRLVFLARVQKRAGSTTHHLSTAAVQAASERSRGKENTVTWSSSWSIRPKNAFSPRWTSTSCKSSRFIASSSFYVIERLREKFFWNLQG